MSKNLTCIFAFAFIAQFCSLPATAQPNDSIWEKQVIHSGIHTNTAIATDFTGDGKADVISSSGGKTRLFVGPEWKELIIEDAKHNCIHSEVFDVDGDGDQDWIGAQYEPGLIYWLECPDDPLNQPWNYHLIEDRLVGIHGLMIGDVDKDGKVDLLANSAQPKGEFPESLAWLKVPEDPRNANRWKVNIFAKSDAPGLSHYLGFGDINGDGRPDAASGAKGGPWDKKGEGNWFAWWESGSDPAEPWKKHLLSDKQPGATNILPADVNQDGKVDLVASRGHGQGVIWFENPKWNVHSIDAELKEPHCLVVKDLDEDGDIDVATCGFGAKVAAWYQNDGKGGFKKQILDKNQEAYDIRATDMDGDKDLDILIAGRGSKNVVWYRNPHRQSKQKVTAENNKDLFGETQTVVVLGDSITYAGMYVAYLEAHLKIANPDRKIEFINIGLPSETISGLSEDGHAGGRFPRPDLHERLERVLENLKPELVVACYGMNCGIYLPYSPERFDAYKNGVKKLKTKVEKQGGKVIFVTPPVFDPNPIRSRVKPAGQPGMYELYDDVLTLYSSWLLAKRGNGWQTINTHFPMKSFIKSNRKTNANFTLAKDGVHLNAQGHWLVAREILSALQLNVGGETFAESTKHPNAGKLVGLIKKKQKIVCDAWLNKIGHMRPGMSKGVSPEQATEEAKKLNAQISELLNSEPRK